MDHPATYLPEVLQTDDWLMGWHASREGMDTEREQAFRRGYRFGWACARSTQRRFLGGCLLVTGGMIAGFTIALSAFA